MLKAIDDALSSDILSIMLSCFQLLDDWAQYGRSFKLNVNEKPFDF